MNNNELDRQDTDAMMQNDEAMELMKDIAIETQNEPFVIYGLFFLFATVEKLLKDGKPHMVSDLASLCQIALYDESINTSAGAERLAKTIHSVYRDVDFTEQDNYKIAEVFIRAELSAGKEKSENPAHIPNTTTDAPTISDVPHSRPAKKTEDESE